MKKWRKRSQRAAKDSMAEAARRRDRFGMMRFAVDFISTCNLKLSGYELGKGDLWTSLEARYRDLKAAGHAV